MPVEKAICHFERSDALYRGVEKSIKKTDFSTRLRLARNDIYLLFCDFNIAHTKLIEGIGQDCFFFLG